MKILNLYAGLGGNRKAWKNHEITSVELVPEIAKIYQEIYPDDEVIVADVVKWIRKRDLGEYDFIWSSPPCVTHSCATSFHARYVPDMQSLHGMKVFFDYQIKNDKTIFVIENVQPFWAMKKYLGPLLMPTVKIARHYFWSNRNIPKPSFKLADERIHYDMSKDKHTRSLYMRGSIKLLAKYHGFDLSFLEGFTKTRKDKVLRNMTHWKIGQYILQCVQNQDRLLSFF